MKNIDRLDLILTNNDKISLDGENIKLIKISSCEEHDYVNKKEYATYTYVRINLILDNVLFCDEPIIKEDSIDVLNMKNIKLLGIKYTDEEFSKIIKLPFWKDKDNINTNEKFYINTDGTYTIEFVKPRIKNI